MDGSFEELNGVLSGGGASNSLGNTVASLNTTASPSPLPPSQQQRTAAGSPVDNSIVATATANQSNNKILRLPTERNLFEGGGGGGLLGAHSMPGSFTTSPRIRQANKEAAAKRQQRAQRLAAQEEQQRAHKKRAEGTSDGGGVEGHNGGGDAASDHHSTHSDGFVFASPPMSDDDDDGGCTGDGDGGRSQSPTNRQRRRPLRQRRELTRSEALESMINAPEPTRKARATNKEDNEALTLIDPSKVMVLGGTPFDDDALRLVPNMSTEQLMAIVLMKRKTKNINLMQRAKRLKRTMMMLVLQVQAMALQRMMDAVAKARAEKTLGRLLRPIFLRQRLQKARLRRRHRECPDMPRPTVAMLTNVPLFAELAVFPNLLDRLIAAMDPSTFDLNEHIIRQGESSANMYFVAAGTCVERATIRLRNYNHNSSNHHNNADAHAIGAPFIMGASTTKGPSSSPLSAAKQRQGTLPPPPSSNTINPVASDDDDGPIDADISAAFPKSVVSRRSILLGGGADGPSASPTTVGGDGGGGVSVAMVDADGNPHSVRWDVMASSTNIATGQAMPLVRIVTAVGMGESMHRATPPPNPNPNPNPPRSPPLNSSATTTTTINLAGSISLATGKAFSLSVTRDANGHLMAVDDLKLAATSATTKSNNTSSALVPFGTATPTQAAARQLYQQPNGNTQQYIGQAYECGDVFGDVFGVPIPHTCSVVAATDTVVCWRLTKKAFDAVLNDYTSVPSSARTIVFKAFLKHCLITMPIGHAVHRSVTAMNKIPLFDKISDRLMLRGRFLSSDANGSSPSSASSTLPYGAAASNGIESGAVSRTVSMGVPSHSNAQPQNYAQQSHWTGIGGDSLSASLNPSSSAAARACGTATAIAITSSPLYRRDRLNSVIDGQFNTLGLMTEEGAAAIAAAMLAAGGATSDNPAAAAPPLPPPSVSGAGGGSPPRRVPSPKPAPLKKPTATFLFPTDSGAEGGGGAATDSADAAHHHPFSSTPPPQHISAFGVSPNVSAATSRRQTIMALVAAAGDQQQQQGNGGGGPSAGHSGVVSDAVLAASVQKGFLPAESQTLRPMDNPNRLYYTVAGGKQHLAKLPPLPQQQQHHAASSPLKGSASPPSSSSPPHPPFVGSGTPPDDSGAGYTIPHLALGTFTPVVFARGDVLFQEGHRSEYVYLLVAGEVSLDNTSVHTQCPTAPMGFGGGGGASIPHAANAVGVPWDIDAKAAAIMQYSCFNANHLHYNNGAALTGNAANSRAIALSGGDYHNPSTTLRYRRQSAAFLGGGGGGPYANHANAASTSAAHMSGGPTSTSTAATASGFGGPLGLDPLAYYSAAVAQSKQRQAEQQADLFNGLAAASMSAQRSLAATLGSSGAASPAKRRSAIQLQQQQQGGQQKASASSSAAKKKDAAASALPIPTHYIWLGHHSVILDMPHSHTCRVVSTVCKVYAMRRVDFIDTLVYQTGLMTSIARGMMHIRASKLPRVLLSRPEWLNYVPLCHYIPLNRRKLLVKSAVPFCLPAGTLLTSQLTPVTHIIIVASGSLRMAPVHGGYMPREPARACWYDAPPALATDAHYYAEGEAADEDEEEMEQQLATLQGLGIGGGAAANPFGGAFGNANGNSAGALMGGLSPSPPMHRRASSLTAAPAEGTDGGGGASPIGSGTPSMRPRRETTKAALPQAARRATAASLAAQHLQQQQQQEQASRDMFLLSPETQALLNANLPARNADYPSVVGEVDIDAPAKHLLYPPSLEWLRLYTSAPFRIPPNSAAAALAEREATASNMSERESRRMGGYSGGTTANAPNHYNNNSSASASSPLPPRGGGAASQPPFSPLTSIAAAAAHGNMGSASRSSPAPPSSPPPPLSSALFAGGGQSNNNAPSSPLMGGGGGGSPRIRRTSFLSPLDGADAVGGAGVGGGAASNALNGSGSPLFGGMGSGGFGLMRDRSASSVFGGSSFLSASQLQAKQHATALAAQERLKEQQRLEEQQRRQEQQYTHAAQPVKYVLGGAWEALVAPEWSETVEASTLVEGWMIPISSLRRVYNALPHAVQQRMLLYARAMQRDALGLEAEIEGPAFKEHHASHTISNHSHGNTTSRHGPRGGGSDPLSDTRTSNGPVLDGALAMSMSMAGGRGGAKGSPSSSSRHQSPASLGKSPRGGGGGDDSLSATTTSLGATQQRLQMSPSPPSSAGGKGNSPLRGRPNGGGGPASSSASGGDSLADHPHHHDTYTAATAGSGDGAGGSDGLSALLASFKQHTLPTNANASTAALRQPPLHEVIVPIMGVAGSSSSISSHPLSPRGAHNSREPSLAANASVDVSQHDTFQPQRKPSMKRLQAVPAASSSSAATTASQPTPTTNSAGGGPGVSNFHTYAHYQRAHAEQAAAQAAGDKALFSNSPQPGGMRRGGSATATAATRGGGGDASKKHLGMSEEAYQQSIAVRPELRNATDGLMNPSAMLDSIAKERRAAEKRLADEALRRSRAKGAQLQAYHRAKAMGNVGGRDGGPFSGQVDTLQTTCSKRRAEEEESGDGHNALLRRGVSPNRKVAGTLHTADTLLLDAEWRRIRLEAKAEAKRIEAARRRPLLHEDDGDDGAIGGMGGSDGDGASLKVAHPLHAAGASASAAPFSHRAALPQPSQRQQQRQHARELADEVLYEEHVASVEWDLPHTIAQQRARGVEVGGGADDSRRKEGDGEGTSSMAAGHSTTDASTAGLHGGGGGREGGSSVVGSDEAFHKRLLVAALGRPKNIVTGVDDDGGDVVDYRTGGGVGDGEGLRGGGAGGSSSAVIATDADRYTDFSDALGGVRVPIVMAKAVSSSLSHANPHNSSGGRSHTLSPRRATGPSSSPSSLLSASPSVIAASSRVASSPSHAIGGGGVRPSSMARTTPSRGAATSIAPTVPLALPPAPPLSVGRVPSALNPILAGGAPPPHPRPSSSSVAAAASPRTARVLLAGGGGGGSRGTTTSVGGTARGGSASTSALRPATAGPASTSSNMIVGGGFASPSRSIMNSSSGTTTAATAAASFPGSTASPSPRREPVAPPHFVPPPSSPNMSRINTHHARASPSRNVSSSAVGVTTPRARTARAALAGQLRSHQERQLGAQRGGGFGAFAASSSR